MSDQVRVEYDKLAQATNSFSHQADAVSTMLNMLVCKLDPLRAGSFQGPAADAFFKEVDDLLLPAVKKLHELLIESGAVTNELTRMFQQADEESSDRFKAYC